MGFTVSLTALADKFKADIATIVSKTTLLTFASVIKRSPVDTGRFKGNWNASFQVPVYSFDERKDRSPLNTLGPLSEEKVRGVLTLPVGGITYLSNGLPYAARLEDGHSQKQAPSGMVRLTVIEFDTFVQEAIKAA